MTNILLRIFVKNRERTDDPKVRGAYGLLSGLVGIVCNVLLFALKLTVGTLSGSLAITADAVNNLMDSANSVVTLIGFKLAALPPDEEHPYGHARIEYLTGLAVAAAILLIGVELGKSSFDKILHPTAVEFSWAVAVVLGLGILLKLWLGRFNRQLGKRIGSAALLATATDSRNDAISTTGVLAAALVGHWTGLSIDGYVGLAVAALILWSGVSMAKDTVSPLLGEGADPELYRQVDEAIRQCPLVLGLHDLLVHDYGPGQRFASVHVEMDHREDAMVCHDTIDVIERRIWKDLHIHLVIHYDPVVTDDPETERLRALVAAAAQRIHPDMGVHDFRTVPGNTHTNLIFDLTVPPKLMDQKKQIQRSIDEALAGEDHMYHTVITFDSTAFNPKITR